MITRFEKVIVGVIVGLLLFMVLSVVCLMCLIEQAGGVEKMTIEAGRGARRVAEEIQK